MYELLDISNKLLEFSNVIKAFHAGESPIGICGMCDGQKAHFVASVRRELDRPVCVITPTRNSAVRMRKDLEQYLGKDAVLVEASELRLFKVEAANEDSFYSQAASLYALKTALVSIIPAESLLRFVDEGIETVGISVGGVVPGTLPETLVGMGYKRVDEVSGCGQFSKRGGIFDIFSPGAEPVRMELFGDECDSLRYFDCVTQLSGEPISEFTIIPAVVSSLPRDLDGGNAKKSVGSCLSYLKSDTVFFLDEPSRIREAAEGFISDLENTAREFIEKGEELAVLPPFCHTLDGQLKKMPRQFRMHTLGEHRYTFVTQSVSEYNGRLAQLLEDLAQYVKEKFRIIIFAGNKGKRVCAMIREHGLSADYMEGGELSPNITVMDGSVSKGFMYPLINTVVINGSDLFFRKQKRAAVDSKKAIKSFSSLSVGDYVTHQQYGIAKYSGIEQITVLGVTKDYLKLQYDGTDCLYLPVSQLNVLYKHSADVNVHDSPPKLSSLSSSKWQKTKSRAKKSVEDLAEKLIALYAERTVAKGYAFSPDTVWQKDFEDSFPYEETPDQLKSIEDAKSDMESARPMDRLLCGDVGYGKTEVALRAAFKCVMDGLQCAYLVPTTVLATQHYNTFAQRMKDFPVKVSILSRFRTPKEQKKVIEGLKTGEVDVVIGTHKLLNRAITYKKLGLLIVDEEQRFGVSHKEKIKELKAGIDVLTLTATPIPRTLHMSLIGIRDLSVLSMPPEDRLAVSTFVLEYDGAIIGRAINRELDRGGQVFYIHNRVAGIANCAKRVAALAPDARIAVAHGQMNEHELEDIMINVVSGDIDILVCTTIIETGIDIPNANTLIVEHSDYFGLAQLYQLRGRVGRQSRQAYAYFTYKKEKILNETAERRLVAIKDFTELGAGYKIAMRDLEIRGVGNILGREQHGFMESIGYEMYGRLLEDAIKEKRGEDSGRDILIDVNVTAFIPKDYIAAADTRIEFYKKIAAISDDAADIIDELIDRFGEPPPETVNLINIALLKGDMQKAGIIELNQKNSVISIMFDPEKVSDGFYQAIIKNRLKMSKTGEPIVKWNVEGISDILSNIKIMLQALQYSI